MAAVSELAAPTPKTASDRGLWSWITTVDHKRIGIMYLLSAAFFFILGGAEAFIMRLQLMSPNGHVVSAETFNQLFTMHGTTMIFLVAMPGLIGFINCIVPLQIGARDVAFPRLNALSFWLFLVGGLFLNSSWLLGGAPDAGWFNYVPIASSAFNPGHGIDFYDLGLQLAGIGTLATGINFMVTIINMRAPGMTLLRMPMFVWATLVTMFLIIFAFPPLTVNLFLLMFDRFFGSNFFNVAAGGNPILWMHLFWIFGHPEVYIVILPAFGIISEVVPVFARKNLFGYTSMVGALLVIGLLAYIVWVHHMFTVGLGPLVNSLFAFSSMLIAVPTGIKIFNWIATMWGGRLRFDTPLLWAIGMILNFTIGGMSGVMLAVAPGDYQYNDSYFLVAHFHYVLIGGTLFALMAAVHYWWPKITGRMLSETLGKWAFWITVIGFNITFFPMHILGLMGMPRRIASYPAGLGWHEWNLISTLGVFVLTVGFLVAVYNLGRSLLVGELAAADPWDARTLEWSLPSPVPAYNFAYIPQVRGRDAFWLEKQAGNGVMRPADPEEARRGIHMPLPTALPALLALAMMGAAYGLMFHLVWLLAIALATAVVTLHRYMFAEEQGRVIHPPVGQVPAALSAGGGAGVEHKGGGE